MRYLVTQSASVERDKQGRWCVVENVREFESLYAPAHDLRLLKPLRVPMTATYRDALRCAREQYGLEL